MTIIHEKWGEVEGVELRERFPCGWFKRGASYSYAEGWREKVAERWKEDSEALLECEARGGVELSIGGARRALSLNRRWAVVERYALPPGWWGDWFSSGAISPAAWVETFKRPCLIIERKVGK